MTRTTQDKRAAILEAAERVKAIQRAHDQDVIRACKKLSDACTACAVSMLPAANILMDGYTEAGRLAGKAFQSLDTTKTVRGK